MSVLAYEYPPNSTAELVKLTIEVVYDFLEEEICKGNTQDIILIGRSVGSGPTMHMIHKLEQNDVEIDCVVLVSPILSIKKEISSSNWMCGIGQCVSFFVNERFGNDKIVQNLTCPLLLIHGKNDEILPCKSSRELFWMYGGERDENVKLEIIDDKTHATICDPMLIAQKIIAFRENQIKNNI
jgi:alpha-beta hydrolase superfamily lysophospholipase